MRRRDFVASVSGAIVAWPIVSHAQQSAMPVIGYLSARSPQESAPHLAAFRRGLSDAGYAEGRNVAIEYRWAEGRYDRLPTLASELVSRRINVIAAIADPTPRTAIEATRTIPIVFAANGDPIRDGLVTSLGRPDGNANGDHHIWSRVAGAGA